MLCLGMQWSSLKLGLDSKSDGSSARKTWYFIPVWIVKSRLKEPSEDQTPQYASITSRSDSTNWCLFVVSFFITSIQLEIYLPSLVNVTNITNLTNEKNQLYRLWLTISQKYKFHIIYILNPISNIWITNQLNPISLSTINPHLGYILHVGRNPKYTARSSHAEASMEGRKSLVFDGGAPKKWRSPDVSSDIVPKIHPLPSGKLLHNYGKSHHVVAG